MNNVLLSFIVVPLAAAFLAPVFGRAHPRLPEAVGFLSALYLLGAAIFSYLGFPVCPLLCYRGLVLDGLSRLLILSISLVAVMVTFYSISYMEKYTAKGKYYALLMLTFAGMNGAVLSGNLFILFIFMEMAELSSCALVAFRLEAKEMEAAFKYLLMGSAASIFILSGSGLVYGMTGTLNMAEIARAFPEGASAAKIFIMAFFIFGFGTKAALVPFHAWLLDAHSSAPAPVSAILSGVLIKALGVYALLRVSYNVFGMTPALSSIFMFLGAASIIVGSFLALCQNDFKRLLACSSFSQTGYIVLAAGLNTPLGLIGGLFHLLNHAIFKSLLCFNAGAVEHATGTRNLDELGGLYKKMPTTAKTSLIASMSISGIPPFNGFWSKLLIIIACIQAGRLWFAVVAAAGSIMTLAYFLKLQQKVFFGELPERLAGTKEAPWTMRIPMLALALLCLVLGLIFPYLIIFLINPAAMAVNSGLAYSRAILGGF